MSQQERQTAYRQLVQALLECPQNDEERILVNNRNLVDEGLVKALKDTAKMMMIRNNPALGATIHRLVSFAQQLERRLAARQSELVELKQEDYIRFSLELLKIVADSQGDGEIVHHFFDSHLAYLNEQLLTIFPQSIQALLDREKDRHWQADIASILHNLAIDLQEYHKGDRSINFALSIACKERSLLVSSQPDEQTIQWSGSGKNWTGTEIVKPDEDRQTAYFELVHALIQCPLNGEDRVLQTYPELVDKGLVMALLEVAEIRKEHNNPDSASTIEWLESFAEKLSQELELRSGTNQPKDKEEPEDFFLDLLQTVANSQGDEGIVHQFLDEHLDDLDEQLLAVIPQSIEALLARQQDSDRQAYTRSIIQNLAINLQTYPSGDRSINLKLSIACKEQSLLVHSQLNEQTIQSGNCTNDLPETEIEIDRFPHAEAVPPNENDNIEIELDERIITVVTPTSLPITEAVPPNENDNIKIELDERIITVVTPTSLLITEAVPPNENDNIEIELDERIVTVVTPISLAITEAVPPNENNNIEIELDERIVTVVSPINLAIDTLKTNRDLGQIYFNQGEWQLAANAYEIAIQAVETSRNLVIDKQQRQEMLDDALSIYENALHCAINIKNYPQAIQYTERLRSLDPGIVGQIPVETIDYPAIQQLIHSPQTAILTWYTTNDDTHIFIIKQSGAPTIHTCKNQGKQKFQNWLQKTWINPCHEDNSNWAENLPRLLHNISQRLELDTLIEQHLSDIIELIIVPHLNLHQIPFAALPLTPAEGGFSGLLGDKFIIRSMPSCQLASPDATTNMGTIEDPDDSLLGASSAQSTLWSVDDYLTIIFNIMYHQERCQGSNRAISLRTAQSQLRNLTGAEFQRYYYPHAIEYVTKHHPTLKTSLENHLEAYCAMDKPFESPYYWAAFITQGMA
jgi:CHAT domain-containing protein